MPHELTKKTFHDVISNEKKSGAVLEESVNGGFQQKKCRQHPKVRELLKRQKMCGYALIDQDKNRDCV